MFSRRAAAAVRPAPWRGGQVFHLLRAVPRLGVLCTQPLVGGEEGPTFGHLPPAVEMADDPPGLTHEKNTRGSAPWRKPAPPEAVKASRRDRSNVERRS